MPVLQVSEQDARRIYRSVIYTERTQPPPGRAKPKGAGSGGSAAPAHAAGLKPIRIVSVVETDPILGPHLLVKPQAPIAPAGGEPLLWQDASPQIVNVTVGGTITAGLTFTISANGGPVATHTTAAGATADTVRDALIASFNAGPLGGIVTPSIGGPGIVTLTAQNDESEYEYTLNTPGGGATFTLQVITNLVAYGDAKVREAMESGAALGTMFPLNTRFWMTTFGGYNVVLLLPVGMTGTLDILMSFDPLTCSFQQATCNIVQGLIVEVT